jgi:TM2 domain-containing membrane protein YozV
MTMPIRAPRSWYIALLLSLFLGWFGADRFYICRYKGAWMKLCTFGGLGIWWLSDLILIASEYRKDRWYRPLVHSWNPAKDWNGI